MSGEGEKGVLEYPEQVKSHRVLKLLHEKLQEVNAKGHGRLELRIYRKDKRVSTWKKTGVYIRATKEDVSDRLGLNPWQFGTTLARLANAGYVKLPRRTNVTGDPQKDVTIFVEYITEAGLREIGELPNPQERLIHGFEAAIEAIKHDDRLSEPEKERRIDWLEEGKIVARTLTTDAIRAILAGGVL